MKTTIEHLPKHKQDEINAVVKTVTGNYADTEMIILFGSYATGKWVEDVQKIDGNEFGYKSDYDLLIILHTNRNATNSLYTAGIDKAIRELKLSTPVGAIYHGIDFVNKQISEGSYFFHEIIEQGIMLYNSNRHELVPIRELNIIELKEKAIRDYGIWFISANNSFEMYLSGVEKALYKEAVFNLHQATERYYATILLVFTGYKPKTHDIEELENLRQQPGFTFLKSILRETKQQQDYFQLLKRAYVDARYNVNYTITKEDLEYIETRVQLLKNLTEVICQEKIASFEKKN